MTETVEERLKRITDYVDMYDGPLPMLNLGDLNWLIARAQLAEKFGAYIDGHAIGVESITRYTNQIKDENRQLRENYMELAFQENAMQANYQFAFKWMQTYKGHLDEIVAAMNTERPAEEKTKDIRRILDGVK